MNPWASASFSKGAVAQSMFMCACTVEPLYTIEDTIELAVLYEEVSLIQRYVALYIVLRM